MKGTLTGGAAWAAALVVGLGVGCAQAQCLPGWVPGVGEGAANNGPARAMAVVPQGAAGAGDVLVMGTFSSIDGLTTDGAARFRPSTNTFEPITGGPVQGGVRAIVMLPNGDAIVGGNFYFLEGSTDLVRSIARYHAATGTWSGLGGVAASGGANAAEVEALALLPDGDLVAGGRFTSAGGVPVNRIARYNFTTGVWSPLGAGVTGSTPGRGVYAFHMLSSGELLVGGEFTTAGGQPASNLARYNLQTGVWTPLSPGPNGAVTCIAEMPSGDLIFGGVFGQAGTVLSPYAIRYTPSTNTWTSMGFAFNYYVFALQPLPDGSVVAGGYFSANPRHLARHDPVLNTWVQLGAPLSNLVDDMALLPNGDLLVCGGFRSQPGLPYNIVARYTFGGHCCGTSDFNGDGDSGTDQDIEAFFACLGGNCCGTCYAGGSDFNGDGDSGTDQDIESFFRVLGGGAC